MVAILEVTRFWGFCAIVASINVVISGLLGLVQMCRHQGGTSGDPERIGGEEFFKWAQSAETAMMPSVAMLNEEIAGERKYRMDTTKDSSEAMKARYKVAYGETSGRSAFEMEMSNHQEEERVAKAANVHNITMMVVKVLIGNCMMLWLQSSFYAVTFDNTGPEAKIKICISMIASAVQAVLRCKLLIPKLGAIGAAMSGIAMLVVVCSGAKVYFTYNCDSHLWNLSSGCVPIADVLPLE